MVLYLQAPDGEIVWEKTPARLKTLRTWDVDRQEHRTFRSLEELAQYQIMWAKMRGWPVRTLEKGKRWKVGNNTMILARSLPKRSNPSKQPRSKKTVRRKTTKKKNPAPKKARVVALYDAVKKRNKWASRVQVFPDGYAPHELASVPAYTTKREAVKQAKETAEDFVHVFFPAKQWRQQVKAGHVDRLGVYDPSKPHPV